MAEPVSGNAVRVLLALCRVHARDGRATVRKVNAEAGLSVGPTHCGLWELRTAGLVTWAQGKTGTLRPLVREHPLTKDVA